MHACKGLIAACLVYNDLQEQGAEVNSDWPGVINLHPQYFENQTKTKH